MKIAKYVLFFYVLYIFTLFFLKDVESTLDTTSGHLKLADFGNAARLSTSGSITKVIKVHHFLPVKPTFCALNDNWKRIQFTEKIFSIYERSLYVSSQ